MTKLFYITCLFILGLNTILFPESGQEYNFSYTFFFLLFLSVSIRIFLIPFSHFHSSVFSYQHCRYDKNHILTAYKSLTINK